MDPEDAETVPADALTRALLSPEGPWGAGYYPKGGGGGWGKSDWGGGGGTCALLLTSQKMPETKGVGRWNAWEQLMTVGQYLVVR